MDLLTPEQVAKKLGVKTITVYKWAQSNDIPCYRLGRLVRFLDEDIDVYINERRVEKN